MEGTISIDLTLIYYAAGVFPMVLMAACSAIFFIYGYTQLYDYVPTISEMMAEHPECRIFCATMSIESVFICIYSIIRGRMFDFMFDTSEMKHETFAKVMRALMKILDIIAAIGMIGFGCFTVNTNIRLHYASAETFFTTCLLQFILGDVFDWKYGRSPSWYSILGTVSGSVLIVFTLCIWMIVTGGSNHQFWWSVSSITEFLTVGSLFAKMTFVGRSYPRMCLVVTKD